MLALADGRTTDGGRVSSRFTAIAGVLTCVVLLGCGAAPPRPAGPADPVRAQRLEMVRLIMAEGVTDSATLAAMRAVPRDQFVPLAHRKMAHEDRALPLEAGATISQPQIVAIMTQAIQPRPGLRVLEVGTGSGYQAALLSYIGCRVHSIEIVRSLADSARARLASLGYRNVEIRHGDGYQGWPEAAPFDAVLVTAATERVPQALLDQLAPGGRLVAPVGKEDHIQWLTLLEKDEAGELRRKVLLPVRFVPMHHDVR